MSVNIFAQCIYFLSHAPHQVVIQISQKGDRLWYDFDLLKSECTFTIFRVGKLNSSEDEQPADPALSSSPAQKPHSTLQASTLHDKPVAESAADDIVRLTQPCVYHDGDSVQQTYVCQQPGNYVLQWRHSTSHHTNSPFDFISGSHKTKIMYRCERQSAGSLAVDSAANGGERRTSLTTS